MTARYLGSTLRQEGGPHGRHPSSAIAFGSGSELSQWIGCTELNLSLSVLASEIEQLPDLPGFVEFASAPEWRRVKLEFHA